MFQDYHFFRSHIYVGALISIFMFSACIQEKEIVPEIFKPRNDHEAYLHSLDKAGLLKSALGIEWQEAAAKAITFPMMIEMPFAEEFYVNPAQASAVGYRFSVQRGQKIEIDLKVASSDSIEIFLDVYRVDNDSLGLYTHVASAAEKDLVIDFEPQVNGDYIMRLQSELLRGGIFRVEVQKVPALSFPVAGKNKSAIGSLFGAPRDGGKRKHHGVDIFARRHTPIIAPTEGRVRRTGDGGLGGKVVWLRDSERDHTLYFAHLNEILVKRGDYVFPGDTLGTVGNTGNARTTPPHLHFGIYNNGPLDPYHFIAETRTRLKRELANSDLLGQTLRTVKKTNMKVSGLVRKSNKRDLPKYQIMEATGASAAYYRVRLPNGEEGYISYADVEIADKPIRRQLVIKDDRLLSSPGITALHINKIENGEQLNILGSYKDYSFVEQANGRKGWVHSL